MGEKGSSATLVPTRESDRVEFKIDDATLQQLAATVCAFLNSHGGTIFLGVGEQGQVVGVVNPEQRTGDIRSALQDLVTPKAVLSVNVDEVDGRHVVTIEVPEGQERPYVCGGSIFVRRGTQTVPADAEVIHRMIETRYRTASRWERQSAAGYDLSDLDAQEFQETVKRIRERGRHQLPDTTDMSGILYSLSLFQAGSITNAGAVLFAANPCRQLPQTRVRATTYANGKGGDYIDDLLLEGHAFSMLDQLLDSLKRNVRLVAEFEPGRMERTDRPEYPFAALREGLMNSLTHRDYSAFDGGMSLGIYPDRIEIWNSGALPDGMTVGALRRPHRSLPPNPDIAHVFYLRGLIERIGRGTMKIIEDCMAAKLRAPTWTTGKSGVSLTIYGRSSTGSEAKLNSRQRDLLSHLRPGDELVPGEYYTRMQGTISQRQAQRDLRALEAGGWLRQAGEGPGTVYTRTERGAI